MAEANPMRRSVSFNLKPQVQLYTIKTPHSSPELRSQTAGLHGMMQSLDLSAVSTELAQLMQPIQSAQSAQSAQSVQSTQSPSNRENPALKPLAISITQIKPDLTPEEFAVVTLSPRSLAMPNPLSPRSVREILAMRAHEQICITEALHEANAMQYTRGSPIVQ